MTNVHLKEDIDRLATGLPDHPDLAAYRRGGRALRRRRRATIGVGVGALAVAAGVPFLGGGDVVERTADSVATEPTASATTSAPATGPVDESFGTGMRAAVQEAVPGAVLATEGYYDHWTTRKSGVRAVAVSSPPDWANVFTWVQEYESTDLQVLTASADWQWTPSPMRWCAGASFEVEKDCTVTEQDGWTIVVHDGIRLRGESPGEWGRMVEVYSPPSDRSGADLRTEASAQVEDMGWDEAAATLPSADVLVALATDERLRLPEPAEVP